MTRQQLAGLNMLGINKAYELLTNGKCFFLFVVVVVLAAACCLQPLTKPLFAATYLCDKQVEVSVHLFYYWFFFAYFQL